MGDFRMPSLGADMDHGKMVEWLVKPGDYVHRGDVVAVVDTDKTVMDIESFEEGVVAELLVDIGATVPIGTPLARITATPDDGSPAAERPAGTPGLAGRAAGGAAPGPPAPAAPAEAARAEHPGAVSPPVRHLAHVLGVDPATVRGTGRHGAVTRSDVERAAVPAAAARPDGVDAGEPGRVRSSPRARRLAAERGLDLASLTGTGPGGAVREEDVLQAVGAAPSTPAAPPREAVLPQDAEGIEAEAKKPPAESVQPPEGRQREAGLRRAVGALLSKSKQTIPHYYLSSTVDLAAAVAWMQSVNLQRPVSSRLVASALLLKATALAAKTVPEVNGFYLDDGFRPSSSVHLGVAVALRKGGIVAPAIHNADTLSVDELMDGLRDLVGRARAGRLQRAEMADPTITVTNLGDLGVDSVFGVIYPPQVAMVGLGRVMEQPWAHNGMLGIRPVVTATLSADHRVSDGLRGARFLARLDELLQKPEEL
ncbi:dihydrolipoamide acetyltransferase family protein [Pseudarthrobacter oxydans]|uniref:dihydrolipoamide acetyltransferase family protein n=1 Tax=Pseudarthrobacter oxydans TaxID=1671 RepID=UPI00342C27B6